MSSTKSRSCVAVITVFRPPPQAHQEVDHLALALRDRAPPWVRRAAELRGQELMPRPMRPVSFLRSTDDAASDPLSARSPFVPASEKRAAGFDPFPSASATAQKPLHQTPSGLNNCTSGFLEYQRHPTRRKSNSDFLSLKSTFFGERLPAEVDAAVLRKNGARRGCSRKR